MVCGCDVIMTMSRKKCDSRIDHRNRSFQSDSMILVVAKVIRFLSVEVAVKNDYNCSSPLKYKQKVHRMR